MDSITVSLEAVLQIVDNLVKSGELGQLLTIRVSKRDVTFVFAERSIQHILRCVFQPCFCHNPCLY